MRSEEEIYHDLRETLEKYNILEDVLLGLRGMGWRRTPPPGDTEPSPPTDLSNLSYRQLCDSLDELGAWWEYLADEITITKTEAIQAQAIEKVAMDFCVLLAELNGIPVSRRKDWVTTAREYMDASRENLLFTAKLTAQIGWQKRIGKSIARLKRHVSIMEAERFKEMGIARGQQFKPDPPRRGGYGPRKTGNRSTTGP